ncbi:MAG: type II secretion system F family protein [Lachnospiraceae bacterium]|nr:type II secretion system F family protein [Lachnospiraceae bacterium]
MATNYGQYRARGTEKIKIMLMGFFITSTIAWLFYKSIFAILLFAPGAILFLRLQEKEKVKKRKWELNQQFKQGILSLSAALNAGYSIENAFREAIRDLSLMYEMDADIIQEFSWISNQISMNRPVEEALMDLAVRTEVEDIENFAEIFQTAKRTGGDIMKIIRKTGKNIEERLEIQREMETMITQKKLEATIMSIVPFGIILYMWIASPGFLDQLYHNIFGVVFMTIILLIYAGAYCMMRKITDIHL